MRLPITFQWRRDYYKTHSQIYYGKVKKNGAPKSVYIARWLMPFAMALPNLVAAIKYHGWQRRRQYEYDRGYAEAMKFVREKRKYMESLTAQEWDALCEIPDKDQDNTFGTPGGTAVVDNLPSAAMLRRQREGIGGA